MISLSIFLIVLALVFVAKGVIIVQQAEVVIVERLGKFDRVLQSEVLFGFIGASRINLSNTELTK